MNLIISSHCMHSTRFGYRIGPILGAILTVPGKDNTKIIVNQSIWCRWKRCYRRAAINTQNLLPQIPEHLTDPVFSIFFREGPSFAPIFSDTHSKEQISNQIVKSSLLKEQDIGRSLTFQSLQKSPAHCSIYLPSISWPYIINDDWLGIVINIINYRKREQNRGHTYENPAKILLVEILATTAKICALILH